MHNCILYTYKITQKTPPFGSAISEMQFKSDTGGSYRYGFNGIEKTNEVAGEGNHYEFKYREYDPRIGKFWSVDPLFKKYPWNSSYAFAENRVIDGIDLEGLEHYYTGDGKLIGKYGTSTEIRIVDKSEVKKATNYFKEYTTNPTAFDKTKKATYLSTTLLNQDNSRPVFSNTDDAAIQWAGVYNRKSIEANREYGSTIYKLTIDGTTYVVYTEAKKGGKAGVTNDDAPTGTSTEVADIHSHGKYLPQYHNNVFSPADKSGNDALKYPGYLSTPNGTLQKYDPATKTESTIKTDIPSDKKDPDRKNKID
jgi:RHS repeat-associated protein